VFFGEQLVELISQIPIAVNSRCGQLELKIKNSEKSIAALSFEALMECNTELNHWSWMKKLKLRPRVELFWWRLYNEAVPSNAFLMKRKLRGIDACPRGCHGEEDCWHIVGNCVKIQNVIKLLNGWGFNIPVFKYFKNCLDELKRYAGYKSFIANLYYTTIFLIWKSRSKLIHEVVEDSNITIAANSISLTPVSNFINLSSYNWDDNQCKLSNSWHPPPPGWIKINVDVALKCNNMAGIGGVVRDEKRRFLLAFGFRYVHWDIAQVELMAVYCLKNFMQDWMYAVQGVMIEGDNFNIIKVLQENLKDWKNK
ncbi:uncharacterized protein LOC110112896, partial [Dendrobium catenatum]|uniref:uncharacterized protein LOC110112896 n=1 Tax=Dendrobium catenatum TaxID=906689 RepID=UPI0009F655C0